MADKDDSEHQLIHSYVDALAASTHSVESTQSTTRQQTEQVVHISTSEMDEHKLIVDNAVKLATSSTRSVTNKEVFVSTLVTTLSVPNGSVQSTDEECVNKDGTTLNAVPPSDPATDKLNSSDVVDSQLHSVESTQSTTRQQTEQVVHISTSEMDEHKLIVDNAVKLATSSTRSVTNKEDAQSPTNQHTSLHSDNDGEHQAIGQLLTTLGKAPTQSGVLSEKDVPVDHQVNQSESNLQKPNLFIEKILNCDQRLAEQRLNVLQLLAGMSAEKSQTVSNELAIEETIEKLQTVSNELAIEETDLCDSPKDNSECPDDRSSDAKVAEALQTSSPSADQPIEKPVTETTEKQTPQIQKQSLSIQITTDENSSNKDTVTSKVVCESVTRQKRRQTDEEHQLISRYTSQLLQKDAPQIDAVNENTAEINSNRTLLLDQLQARNHELKEKLAHLKEVLQAQEDIKTLMQLNEQMMQQVSSLQNKRLELTSKRDEMMKQLKIRNSLWRSPTVSQAGSELSIDTYDDPSSLTTPVTAGSGSFSFPSFDDHARSVADEEASAEQRRQIEELHEQLRQMITSPMSADVTKNLMTVNSETTSSSYCSSVKTVTVKAEISSISSSQTTSLVNQVQISNDGPSDGNSPKADDDADSDNIATPPNSLDAVECVTEIADSPRL